MKRMIKILLCAVLTLLSVFSAFACKKESTPVDSVSNTKTDDFDLLQKVIRFVDENYYKDVDMDQADLYTAVGLVESLGKYNYIYSESSLYSSLSDSSGFGLLVRRTFYNEVLIDWILSGSPFENESDGIKPRRGDEIYAINGNRVSGADSSYFQGLVAETKLGENVEFTLRRTTDNTSVFLTVHYSKVMYNFPYCFYENNLPGIPEDFGYICLRTFDNATSVENEFYEAVQSYLKDNNKALILDLRGNGGGSSTVLSSVASHLIGDVQDDRYYNDKTKKYDVPLVEIQYKKSGYVNTVTTTPSKYLIQDPIYVLADGGTASASEALIGAMKAHGTLTKLIGKPTVGKGVAQNGFVFYSDKDEGFLIDNYTDEEGNAATEGYLVQVIIGEYFIVDDSKEGGRYCMNGVPFEPDIEAGESYVTTSFADDAYIAAAVADFANKSDKKE